MNVTYTPKFNFHSAPPLKLQVEGTKELSHEGIVYRLSYVQARKVRNHFCGVTDCCCNSGALIQLDAENTAFGIPATDCVTEI